MENRMYADRPCDGGHREHGFKFLLPLLLVPVAFGMMRGMARHKFAHMQAAHGQGWEGGVPPMFAEWHRRAHAAQAQAQGQAPTPPPAAPTVES